MSKNRPKTSNLDAFILNTRGSQPDMEQDEAAGDVEMMISENLSQEFDELHDEEDLENVDNNS